MLDIRPLIDQIEATVRNHRLDKTGAYCRWLWMDAENKRELGINEYGCADAANILYTINRFPSDPQERAGWVSTLQGLQHADSGLFLERTHYPIHCTAHCTAALELFDAKPLHPVKELLQYLDPEKMRPFLDQLGWRGEPWWMSHQGAGLYVALVLTDAATLEWQDAYFDWLWEEADPETGFWRRGCIGIQHSAPIFHHLAGSFHYLFNTEYARRPLRYPARMVDSCLKIWEEDTEHIAKDMGFSDIDWVYCLNRSFRQCGHRFEECQRALREMAERYVAMLSSYDYSKQEGWNDLHQLFGATCALAELQTALPGFIRTEKPLRLVLDRRPFI